MGKVLRQLGRDWFMPGMILAVIAASLTPQFGRSGGPVHADLIANAGIFAVFFLHGVGLSTESLLAGLARWRLHGAVQGFTFAVFPLIWLGANALFGRFLSPELMLGFFYLCVLPSTISSSVAMTALAGGNVPAAVFNASLSALLGIFLTPLFVGLLLGASGELSLIDAMLKIAGLLLLPLVLGQLARRWWGAFFARYKPCTGVFDRCVILWLVYASFCDSVANGLWQKHGFGLLGQIALGALLLLALVLWLTRFAARRLGFARGDEITLVFCGSKKTLASGMPMAKLLFGAHPALGVIVLPIMIYHQIQLLVCALLARRYAAKGRAG